MEENFIKTRIYKIYLMNQYNILTNIEFLNKYNKGKIK